MWGWPPRAGCLLASRGKGRRGKRKPTIKPEFKEVFRKSADYADWLKLKQEFLREKKMLFDQQPGGGGRDLGEDARQQPEKIPRGLSASAAGSDADKFPNFPNNAVDPGADAARPQRETLDSSHHEAPAVFVSEGTLYRAPTAPSRINRPTGAGSRSRKKPRRTCPVLVLETWFNSPWSYVA